MLLDLPPELLQKCIHFAIFPHGEETVYITDTPPTPENKKALQSLLLTCRTLSSVTFSYSFSSYLTLSFKDIRARLIPLLPAPILGHFVLQLDKAFDTPCPERKALQECHVPPGTVHTLRLIHDQRGQYNANDIYTAALTTVFRNLFELKALSTAPSSCTDRPTAALSVCPLTSLSCRFSSELVSPQPRNWKLVSLALWGIPVAHGLLSSFLEELAGTLEGLGLGFWRGYTIRDIIGLPAMPRLRRLKMSAALTIETRIRRLDEVNFGTLERVQREQVALDERLVDTKGKRESGEIGSRVWTKAMSRDSDLLGEAQREIVVGAWNIEFGPVIERDRQILRVLEVKCARLKAVTFSGV